MRSLVTLVAGLVLVSAAPAQAQRLKASYEVTGSVQVTWVGAADRCAAAGVCGIRGTMAWAPRASGTVEFDGHGSSGSSTSGRGEPPVVIVEREGSEAVCVDGPTGERDGFDVDFDGGKQLQLTLARGFTALGSGRCAGPRSADIMPQLPTGEVAPSALRPGRRHTADLSARRTFTAGAFDVELVSDVEVAMRGMRTRRRAPRARSRERVPASHRRPRVREVPAAWLEMTYRVERIEGAVEVAVGTTAGAACSLLGACGLAGRLTLTPAPEPEYLVTGLLRGSRARTVAAFLRDARRRRSGLEFVPSGDGERLSQIRAEIGRAGEPTCKDALEVRSPNIAGFVRGDALRVGLEVPFMPGGEMLRSRCPGPADRDVLGGSRRLATGRVPLSALAEGTLTVDLTASGGYRSSGFEGARSGAVRLVLRRTRARVMRTTEMEAHRW